MLAHAQLLRGQKAAAIAACRPRAGEQQRAEDPVPRRRESSRRPAKLRRPSAEMPASPRSCRPSRRPTPRRSKATSRWQTEIRAQAIKALTEANSASGYVDRPLRPRSRVSGGRHVYRRPTRSSIGASSGAAKRSRCSWTRNPRSASSRRSTTTRGRVRESLKSVGSAESYRTYLSIRGASREDPLLPEIRKRAGAQGREPRQRTRMTARFD